MSFGFILQCTYSSVDTTPASKSIKVYREIQQRHGISTAEVPGASVNSMLSVLADTGIVKKQELWEMVGHNRWKINNLLDSKYEPRPVYLIVMDALKLVGEELAYCVLRNNCEHFVTRLRYGKPRSRQVREAGETALGVAAVTLGVVGIAALMATLLGGNKDKHKE
ncbi:phospholipase A and acyltransferase 3-like isoform X2 [Syngnathus typhle]|uniref:phospholipase A and acyltransferase 3-like isoform X2 n=1 Tax=Syngnathus typhle TaxID=161592 RepID=UPI002A6AC63F|nr:phospholipase A and acyltransferase 3-like isoform X2 [Syngnathus typhle]